MLSLREIQNACLKPEHPNYDKSLRVYSDKEFEKLLPKLNKEDLTSFMLLAASQGKFGLVSVFIRAGADRYAVAGNGWTLLMFAANYDNPGVINDILNWPKSVTAEERSAYINRTNPKHETALYLACNNKSEKAAKILAPRKDCDLHISKDNGTTPLYSACWIGSSVIVAILLQRLSDEQIMKSRNDGLTCLNAAVSEGHSQVVNLLLERISDRNWINKEPRNANVLDAAYTLYTEGKDYEEIVCALIMHGADFTETFKNGNPKFSRLYTFMRMRNGQADADTKDIIANYIAMPSKEILYIKMFEALHEDDAILLKKCIDQDLDIDSKVINTTFLLACSAGHVKCIKTLMANRYFDPQVRDAYGQSGLTVACLAKQLKVVMMLLDSATLDALRQTRTILKEELNKQDNPDYTMFDIIDNKIPLPGEAVELVTTADAPIANAADKILDLLSLKSINPRYERADIQHAIRLFNSPGFLNLANPLKTALIEGVLSTSIESFHLPLVECLLKKLAAIPKEQRGSINLSETLVLACQYGDNPVIGALLSAKQELGIDVDHIVRITDDKGIETAYTAWHVAHLFKNEAAIDVLKNHGASDSVGDDNGVLRALYTEPKPTPPPLTRSASLPNLSKCS
jgi:ankyrin repeat protein